MWGYTFDRAEWPVLRAYALEGACSAWLGQDEHGPIWLAPWGPTGLMWSKSDYRWTI